MKLKKLELSKDFEDFIRLLNQHRVRYLIVGGYSVAFHGYPRYTKDIDLLIAVAPDNAKRMVRVINEFGFASLNLQEKDFLEKEMIIQIGMEPNRVDIICGIRGFQFDEYYERREEFLNGDLVLNFVDKAGLKLLKELAGRTKDLADLEELRLIDLNDKDSQGR
ncbi:MAG: hypothetical protein HN580_08785 [Deltaproteobacteria bacterium]|jgi:hypothetical protein|nr:hypothetical protein [Deltaproteobacteria bacterium]MBT4264315.1 hypothetical protein [Deltaproteobacteria bacterium]MBT4641088.1 hypothetical protein [Deltaproteobacteria bacterium]MBT6499721.1 hypothetical protein [Deltaproteobacteria bacterium]MBT7154472.1 hypothetical protein [Deltaproteobacteria bacterium]